MTSTVVLARQVTHSDCWGFEGGLTLAMTLQMSLKVILETSKHHNAALYGFK